MKAEKHLEKITQGWLANDYCDNCDVPIPHGEPIWLDVEHEYAGIIPAYCEKCAKKKEKGESV